MAQREIMAFHADRGVQVDENGRVVLWENQAMAFRIKPEDVTKDFVYGVLERARKSRVDIELGRPHQAEDEIAEFLNAAIEAGLVSPPVYVCRTQWGELNTAAAFVSRENAEKYKNEADRIEHWKGQTP